MTESILSPDAISRNLGTRFIGQRVICYPQLTSTMDAARQEARQGAAEGTVIITDEQTVGKGRIKRRWLSPKGSISLSVILYPRLVHLPNLIMVASLAVVHSIQEVTGLDCQLKWPNDILINGRKVCGILAESDMRGNRVAHAIIGIGINANLRLADFREIPPGATSLLDELGREVSRLDIIRSLLAHLERLYLALPEGDIVYREWRDKLVTLGKRVQVKSGTDTLDGIAESVARDGSLILRHQDGSTTQVVAGDVTLRAHQ